MLPSVGLDSYTEVPKCSAATVGKMPGSLETLRNPCSNPAGRAGAVTPEMPWLGHCTQGSPVASLIMNRAMNAKATSPPVLYSCHCHSCLILGILFPVAICGGSRAGKQRDCPVCQPPPKSLVCMDLSSSFSPDITPFLTQNPVLVGCFQHLQLSASMVPGGLRRAGTAAAPAANLHRPLRPGEMHGRAGAPLPPATAAVMLRERPIVTAATLLHRVKVHREAQAAQPQCAFPVRVEILVLQPRASRR